MSPSIVPSGAKSTSIPCWRPVSVTAVAQSAMAISPRSTWCHGWSVSSS